MEESNYIDMANNINSYLEKYCGITNDEQTKNESVEDVLTKLIHMDKTKENQEGGIIVDDLVENLTGGNVKKEDKKETKNPIISSIKEIDENLLEGGSKKTSTDGNENKDGDASTNTNGKTDTNDETTTTKTHTLSSDSSEEDYYSETTNDYSSDDSDNNDGLNIMTGINDAESEYKNFLKHYQDKEYDYSVISGGDMTKNNKIQIIPMFPYLLRY